MTIRLVPVAALLVLAFAGCTPVPGATGTPPAPTPDPTPTESPLTNPRTALALTCEQLFSLEELQPLLTTAVQVRGDETSAPLGVRGATLQQLGGTLCVYGGENRTDGSYDQGLRVEAVPNAADDYDGYVATLRLDEGIRVDEFADRSVLSCFASGEGYDCWADFVVGDSWVSARMGDESPLDSQAATDTFLSVLSTIVERMRASGPARTLWEPPTGEDPAPLCSRPEAAAALLGVEPASVTAEATSGGWQGVTTPGCRWTSADGRTAWLTYLQSGAWAFPKIEAAPGMRFTTRPIDSTALDVPGTDGALVACGDGCTALVSWRGSLLQLGVDDLYDAGEMSARVQAWGAALP